MQQLRKILLSPIADNERTRRYQESIDRYVARITAEWDVERGWRGSRGVALPHETVHDYWNLPDEERRKLTSPEAAAVYARNAGRDGTHVLAVVGFAWHSSLSRHRGAPDLLRFFENGLRTYTGSIRDDGLFGAYGLNGLSWAHGWDMEGLVYGLMFFWDAMNADVRSQALSRMRLAARRFLKLGRTGTHGNQGLVQTLGLFLYGELLDLPEASAASNERLTELLEQTLDRSGQVVEQYGPCMHYSCTCFIYGWLNTFLRGGMGQEERVARCVKWFRHRYTDVLYPIAGPSSRQYYETINPASMADVLPACEQLAASNPMFQEFADRLWSRMAAQESLPGAGGHGGSQLMWAILANSGVHTPSPEQRRQWDAPFEQSYERIDLLGRSPLKYALIRHRYQTHFNFCDFLPFSGIQTWALGDEPPIIHPTLVAPSTTQAWGLDTARQGVSHNWGLYGAGAMAADGRLMQSKDGLNPSFVLARYDRLWRIVVFTDSSTMILEFGRHGRRKTLWTLNRVEPAAPQIADGVVSFANRRARIYSTIARPALRELEPGKWTAGVRVLEYDCGDGFCAFAFSDESFHFDSGQPLTDGVFGFSDSSGNYRVVLSQKFLLPDDPGSCTVDSWVLAKETQVTRQ